MDCPRGPETGVPGSRRVEKIGAGLGTICQGKRIGIDTLPFRRWKRGTSRGGCAGAIRHVAKIRARTHRFLWKKSQTEKWRRDDYVS